MCTRKGCDLQMTQTVKQIVDEYLNRQTKQNTIEELILSVGDITLTYKEVTNLQIREDGLISFDYDDYISEWDSDNHLIHIPNWKHVVCDATILLMQESLKEE